MLEVPQRRLFSTRDDYLSVFNAAMAELQHAYDSEPIQNVTPSWTEKGQGDRVFFVQLPIDVANTARGEFALIRSLLLGLKDKQVQLLRIARVEKDGMMTLWAECEH
jgi:hypothetical protein